MLITHSLGSTKLEKYVEGNDCCPDFLISNHHGNFLSLGNYPLSRYEGWFVSLEDKSYKILENIEIVPTAKIDQLENNFWQIVRKRGLLEESFVLPEHGNSLIYCLSDTRKIELSLDIREIYDDREFGRSHNIYSEDNAIVVEYLKEGEYTLYLSIVSDTLDYTTFNEWIPRNYTLDKERNSPPFERFVYKAMHLNGKDFVFSVSKDKKNAINEAKHCFSSLKKIKLSKERNALKLLKKTHLKKFKNEEVAMAYICATNSLHGLLNERESSKEKTLGIFAGLPWFFQFWKRDEIISLGSFAKISPKITKSILMDWIDKIKENGLVAIELCESADATGWLFKRIDDFISSGLFNKIDKKKIEVAIEKSIQCLLDHHTCNELAVNLDFGTWMDTQKRDGFRIEIQALRLNMYKLAYRLTGKSKYKKLEKDLLKKVREFFWNGNFLFDGQNDATIRPNIFMAAYVYPQLLKKGEWEKCFEFVLPTLWLDWGGLSSIDKSNPLFCNVYTGQNTTSYHNGDSWFYLNNMTAIVLYKFNKKKFKNTINKILMASAQDILWGGAIGHHSELSSAQKLTSSGCYAQAWSDALFLELADSYFS